MSKSIPEIYGSLVFNDKVMREKLPDVRVGNARIFYEQPYDFLIQCVQPIQIHSVPSVRKASTRIIAPFFPKVNMPLTRRLCRAIIVSIRNYQLSFCEESL